MFKSIHAIIGDFAACSVAALCIALSSCGGGGSSGTVPLEPTPVVPVATPVIKFMGTFEPGCFNCSPAALGSLVISPIAGASELGNRNIAKVEFSIDQGPTQVLTAPNAKNPAGQASYAFYFPPAPVTTPEFTHTCTPKRGLEITVTDIGGFAFKRYESSCRSDVFGAFSDYGLKTVTYAATATAPTLVEFFGGSDDASRKIDASASTTLALKVREADSLGAYGTLNPSAADGAVVSVSLEGDAGEFASSTIAKKTVSQAFALLACCRPTPVPVASSTEVRTVTLAVSTTRYNEPIGGKPPELYNLYYQVKDPSTGSVVSEFRGVGSGMYTAWPVVVRAGYELKLEASPQTVDTHVLLYINSDTQGFNLLGEAMSNRPNVPAKLNVFCCAR